MILTAKPGDSRSHKGSKPTQQVKAVQAWLLAVFGEKFRNEGDTLEHGIQDDESSCGIVTPNTIGHNIFGDPIFRKKNKRLL